MTHHPRAPVSNTIENDSQIRIRAVVAAGLILFTLVFTKAAVAHGLSASVLMPVMVAGYAGVSAMAAPIAVAFLITSAQLLAQVSMAYPGVSAFGIVSLTVLLTTLIVRWRGGWIRVFFKLSWLHYAPWILFALVFSIGFIRALQAPVEGSNSMHYVFLSHWLVYMALGVLACTRLAELKSFLIALSVLYVVAIFPLPFDFYPRFFASIYRDCVAMGLHNMGEIGKIPGSVNRSQVAYLAGMSSLIALSFALHRGGWLGRVFYAWSVLAALVLMLAGSKGAVLGWLVGLLLAWRYSVEEHRRRVLGASLLFVSVLGLLVLGGYSPIPCGTVHHYAEGAISYDTRKILIQQGLDSYSEPQVLAAEIGHARVTNDSVWLNELLGRGLGASAKAINPATGKPLADSGSHNLFLDILVDTGAVGAILFGVALTLLMTQFVLALLKCDDRDRKLLQSSIGCMLVVTLTLFLLTTSTYREYLGASVIGLLAGFAIYGGKPPVSDASYSFGVVADMSEA